MSAPILPGQTVGILGGGQLGRMLVVAARRMGYRTHIYCPEAGAPAALIADATTVAAYDCKEALVRFARDCAVVTLEFENIPVESVRELEAHCPVRPGPGVLHIAQNRGREKAFLQSHQFAVVPHVAIATGDGAEGAAVAAGQKLGYPCVLKTAGFGYDGKGQRKVHNAQELASAVATGEGPWVLEKWQAFVAEASVLVARTIDGAMADWGAVQNQHRNHILDTSMVPADLPEGAGEAAIALAGAIAQSLDLVGLLCVEFFVMADGSVLVNEMAPRPHNSGHWTLEGAVTSQFEQQLRAVCGLPLGSTQILAPTAMANVLGDLWAKGTPKWEAALGDALVKWHDYGKGQARPGRKMGHLTCVGVTPSQAVERVLRVRQAMQPDG